MKRLIYLFLLVCIIGILTSCKNTPIDKVLNNKAENPENNQTIMSIGEREHSTRISEDIVNPVAKIEKTIGQNVVSSLYNKENKGGSSFSEKPFYSFFEEKQKDFGDVNHVSMSYNAAPIDEIVPVFAKILDFDFYLDPNVKGVVTMTVDSNLSKKELWMIFEQILLFTGSYCSLDSGVLHIQPLSLMSQERRLGPGFGYEANVSVVLFRLNNAKSSTLVQQLKPFMTNGAVLIDMPDQNSVLIVETPTNVPKLKAIVGMLDAGKNNSWPRTVITCANVSPSSIADELTKIFPVLGFPVNNLSGSKDAPTDTRQQEKVETINLRGIDRLQLLVVSAANTEVLDEVKKWVDVLDKNDVGDQDNVFVYKVMYIGLPQNQ